MRSVHRKSGGAMKSGRTTWVQALALTALVVGVAACGGVELRRPLIAYDFDNPILNERWLQAHQDPLPPARIQNREIADRAPEPAAPVVAAESPPPAAPASPRGPAPKPLPVVTASEQAVVQFAALTWEDPPPSPPVSFSLPEVPEVKKPAPPAPTNRDQARRDTGGDRPPAPEAADPAPSPEVAEAACRLVGIRTSFDQDSFLKHVLFVSNVSVDDAPGEGLVRWVWERYGKGGGRSLAPGNLVFLGWGGRARFVGVVESVDEHGTARFVTVHGDEVKRMTITPDRPRVRRDERSNRILNSAVDRGRLAGETLMGCVRVIPDSPGSSGLATAD